MNGAIGSMAEAARLVRDGDRVTYVGYMRMEPAAFFHELLRQGRRELRMVLAPSSGWVVDLMIGADALARWSSPACPSWSTVSRRTSAAAPRRVACAIASTPDPPS
jgi:acyl CoA:acetate/3-ketoacid CoA transferase alpha subunit